MSGGKRSTSPSRHRVALALRDAAASFPDLARVDLDVAGLDARDRGLALAIHRTVLQRWLTLAFLLNRHLRQPLAELEPMMQAVLLSGAAQLVFMDRLPVHAVVNDTVELARKLVRPGAAPLANAVLRRVAGDVKDVRRGEAWSPAADRLPIDEGCVVLAEPLLPAVDDPITHLEVATSTPRALLEHWSKAFGTARMQSLAVHSTRLPPTTVAVEPGFVCGEDCHPHARDGFVVWQGSREALIELLTGHPARRVQDPASAAPVQVTAPMTIARAVDYCAGRGTKTRQLAALHPQARIIATDIDPGRFADLTEAFANHPMVTVAPVEQVRSTIGDSRVDLLMLDVPCSNTAVFARRPEARYRWRDRNTRELVDLQRRIAKAALALASPRHILYSTCSLDLRENQNQARWLVRETGGRIVAEEQTWPDGVGDTYHDGSYYALIALD